MKRPRKRASVSKRTFLTISLRLVNTFSFPGTQRAGARENLGTRLLDNGLASLTNFEQTNYCYVAHLLGGGLFINVRF